jgi:hypothetical protein
MTFKNHMTMSSKADSMLLKAASEMEEQRDAVPEPTQEPAAWMRDDGDEGSISTMTVCISTKVRDLWLKANPRQVKRYTIPLYAHPAPEDRRRTVRER